MAMMSTLAKLAVFYAVGGVFTALAFAQLMTGCRASFGSRELPCPRLIVGAAVAVAWPVALLMLLFRPLPAKRPPGPGALGRGRR
jgi:hypothetical protein